jgi:hypothetical protein
VLKFEAAIAGYLSIERRTVLLRAALTRVVMVLQAGPTAREVAVQARRFAHAVKRSSRPIFSLRPREEQVNPGISDRHQDGRISRGHRLSGRGVGAELFLTF